MTRHVKLIKYRQIINKLNWLCIEYKYLHLDMFRNFHLNNFPRMKYLKNQVQILTNIHYTYLFRYRNHHSNICNPEWPMRNLDTIRHLITRNWIYINYRYLHLDMFSNYQLNNFPYMKYLKDQIQILTSILYTWLFHYRNHHSII